MTCDTCHGERFVVVEWSRAEPDHHPDCYGGPSCSDLCPVPVEVIEQDFAPCPDCHEEP